METFLITTLIEETKLALMERNLSFNIEIDQKYWQSGILRLSKFRQKEQKQAFDNLILHQKKLESNLETVTEKVESNFQKKTKTENIFWHCASMVEKITIGTLMEEI